MRSVFPIRSDPSVPPGWWSSAPRAGPAPQAEPALPVMVRAWRKKARGLSPSTDWRRDNGRTGGCSAMTGAEKVQRKKSQKALELKKNSEGLFPVMYSPFDPPCSSGFGSCLCLLYIGLRRAAKTAVANVLGGFAMRKHDTAEPAVTAVRGCWKRVGSDLQPSHKERDLKRTYILC